MRHGWLVGWVGGPGDPPPPREMQQQPAASTCHTTSNRQRGRGGQWAADNLNPFQPFSSWGNYAIRRTNNSPAVKVVLYLVVFVGLVKCQLTISLPRCLFNCHIETKSNGKDENDIAQIIYQIWSGEGGIDIATQKTSKVQKNGVFFLNPKFGSGWGLWKGLDNIIFLNMVNVRHVQ